MKKIENVLRPVAMLCLFCVLFFSCMPTMHLIHQPAADGYTYDSLGSITINSFQDNRPQRERANKVPKNSFVYYHPQKHEPQFDGFVQKAMQDEISQSGLFSLQDGEYELSGKINSFKCINRANGAFIAGYALLGASIIAGERGRSKVTTDYDPYYGSTVKMESNPALLALGLGFSVAALILMLISKDNVEAIVDFEYTLKKNETEVMSNTIYSVVNGKISKMSTKQNMAQTAALLDQSMTIAIRDMIKEINDQKALAQQ